MGSIACIINWGFGFVVGVMFAKEVARRIKGSDYAFTDCLRLYCIYDMGWRFFRCQCHFLAATPGNPVAHLMVSESNPKGIIPAVSTLFLWVQYFYHVKFSHLLAFHYLYDDAQNGEAKSIDPKLIAPDPTFDKELDKDQHLLQKMEESRFLAYTIGALGYSYLGMYFLQKRIQSHN